LRPSSAVQKSKDIVSSSGKVNLPKALPKVNIEFET